jgi:hypothetical protein
VTGPPKAKPRTSPSTSTTSPLSREGGNRSAAAKQASIWLYVARTFFMPFAMSLSPGLCEGEASGLISHCVGSRFDES